MTRSIWLSNCFRYTSDIRKKPSSISQKSSRGEKFKRCLSGRGSSLWPLCSLLLKPMYSSFPEHWKTSNEGDCRSIIKESLVFNTIWYLKRHLYTHYSKCYFLTAKDHYVDVKRDGRRLLWFMWDINSNYKWTFGEKWDGFTFAEPLLILVLF